VITSQPQTDTIPLTPTDWTPTNFSPSVNPAPFTKFDPSLGTLKSVKITLGDMLTQDVSMQFTTAANITVVGDQNHVTVERPDTSTIIDAAIPAYNVSQAYSGPTFPHSITMPTHTTQNTQQPVILTSAADLALFTQSAANDTLIRLPATARSNSMFNSSTGNGFGSVVTNAGATVTIQYTYQPVTPATQLPEPATLAVLGLGIAVFTIAQRRRAKAA
jgi:hypothetical protein